MIGVRMREEHAVHNADSLAEQLRSQVGGGVDQEVAIGQSQNHRAACSVISWIVAGADIAAASQGGHAYGSARPEKNQLAADIGGNWGRIERRGADSRGSF